MLQAGTVAGTITITARLRVGDRDVTPSPAPTRTIDISQAPPTLMDNVRVVKTPAGFDVEVTGYSTTRDIRQAIFRFTPVADRNLKTLEFTVDIASATTTWYQNPAAAAFGSAFHYVQSFTVRGDVTDIESVSVTLVNSRGNSETRSGRF
jgi:hypothetical protein